MASRRKLKAGLSGAFFGFQDFFRFMMAQQEQKRREQALLERQQQGDLADIQRQLFLEGVKSPQVGKRVAGLGIGFPEPPEASLGAGLVDLFNKAKTRSEVPGEEESVETLRAAGMDTSTVNTGGAPPLESELPPFPFRMQPPQVAGPLAARRSKLEALGEAERAEVAQRGATSEAGALGTARGTEAGEAEAFQPSMARALKLAFEKGTQDIGLEKTKEEELRAGKAKTAGRVRAAELSAEFLNPAIVDAKIDIERRRGVAAAAAAGQREWAQQLNQVATTAIGVAQDVARLSELSRLVNIRSTSILAIPARVMTAAGAKAQTNPNAAEMNAISENLARRLANDPFFGGNRGAQSEADAKAMRGRLPSAGDTEVQAKRLLTSFNKNMVNIVQVMGKIDPLLPVHQKVNIAREAFGLPPIQNESEEIPLPTDETDLLSPKAKLRR